MTSRRSLLMFAMVACACGPSGSYVWVQDLPRPAAEASARLRAGDKIQLVVQGQDAMGGEFEVRPSGDVVLPQIGRLPAQDLTVEQLTVQVTARLRGVLQNPVAMIVLVGRRAPLVSVLGEVQTPGRFELKDGEGVLEVLARAGGFTPFADKDRIFVIPDKQSGTRVRFRYGDLARGDPQSVNYALGDGDVVIVE